MNVAAAVRSVIWNANRNSSGRNKPTVIHIPGLNTEPFPNVNIHQKITVDEIKQLKTKFNEIDTKLEWSINEKSNGVWRIAHLINQGDPSSNLAVLERNCSDLSSLFSLVPPNKLFGAAFSEVSHDFNGPSMQTLIAPHFGVTNAKWRLHIPLFVDSDFLNTLFIHVDNERRNWSSSFTIDDSFEHNVLLTRDESRTAAGLRKRTVLLIDIWNENLSVEETCCLDYVIKLLL